MCIATNSWWGCKWRPCLDDRGSELYNIIYQNSFFSIPLTTITLPSVSSPGANYHLSVLPFLAAVETGLVGDGQTQVEIQVPAELAADYCSSTCSTVNPDAMNKWVSFFKVRSLIQL